MEHTRRQHGQTAQVHVRATVRTNGKRRQKRQTLGHAASRKIHGVRNAGEYCFRGGLGLETGWARARMPPAKRRAGARVSIAKKAYGRSHANAGAAGAAIRPVVPHSPSGQWTAKRRRLVLWPN